MNRTHDGRAGTPTGVEPSPAVGWYSLLAAGMFLGHSLVRRSFAHLGIRPVYISEVALIVLLGTRLREITAAIVHAMVKGGPLAGIAWALAISLAYGVVEALRGFEAFPYPMATLQCLAFQYYPLYLLVGLWAVRDRWPELLPRLVLTMAWWNGLYGALYLVVLHRFFPENSADPAYVPPFGHSAGAGVALLGLMCLEQDRKRMGVPFLLNLFVLLGGQCRAEWLSTAIAISLWGLLSGHLWRLTKLAAFAVGLMGVAYLTDFSIPAPNERGGTISARNVVGRAMAAIDPQAASRYADDIDLYAGTVAWRKDWWREIWKTTNRDAVATVIGWGYGYPLWELHPSDELIVESQVRTPHNIFFFTFAYTGWVGTCIFYLFQLLLAQTLWRVYRRTGQPLGICHLVMFVIWAHFDNLLETPSGAVRYYLLVGATAAPVLWPAVESQAGLTLDVETRSPAASASTTTS